MTVKADMASVATATAVIALVLVRTGCHMAVGAGGVGMACMTVGVGSVVAAMVPVAMATVALAGRAVTADRTVSIVGHWCVQGDGAIGPAVTDAISGCSPGTAVGADDGGIIWTAEAAGDGGMVCTGRHTAAGAGGCCTLDMAVGFNGCTVGTAVGAGDGCTSASAVVTRSAVGAVRRTSRRIPSA